MSEPNAVVITKQTDIFPLYPRLPILTSLSANWQGFSLGYMCQPAYQFPEVYSPRWHSVAIFMHGARVIHADRKLDGRSQRDAVVGGDILVNPVNVGHQAAWDAEGDFIILAFEPQIVTRTVDESQGVELIPHFATPDPLIYQIGLALKTVLEKDATRSRLYAETMMNALSVHLLENYSTRKLGVKEYSRGLSQRQLQQVTDYIYAHLDQDLGLTELAGLIHISPHYFSQLFKQATGMTPHKYVIYCRVERAKELLLQGQLGIAEIADLVGFASQSHLNFHCKRLLGVTPKTLQKR